MTYRRKEVIGGQTMILGDCAEVMAGLEPVDLLLTDPPFGIGESSRKVASRSNAAAAKDYGFFDWDKEPARPEAISAARTLANHQIIFGGNYFEGLPPSSCWLVWDKENSGDFADCELAWTNLKRAVRIFRWRWNGMIRKGNEQRLHPTQKPVALMEWCLGFLPNAQTILDPFMGSGTTLVACQRLGRNGIGIELDPDYFEIACKRVDEATRQPDMFVQQPEPKFVQDGFDL